jgi:hypothetical protein
MRKLRFSTRSLRIGSCPCDDDPRAFEKVGLAPVYDCKKCPGYCCSYPLIALTRRDVARLAKHLGLSFEACERRHTRRVHGRKWAMRRKADKHFGGVCKFFDVEKRHCTVYAGRPAVCRAFPGKGRCGYYDFLMFERRAQDDPDFVSVTTHK